MSLAINILLSAITCGDPTLTLSARAALAREHGHRSGRIACKILNGLDLSETATEDHCERALRHDRERRALGHHAGYYEDEDLQEK